MASHWRDAARQILEVAESDSEEENPDFEEVISRIQLPHLREATEDLVDYLRKVKRRVDVVRKTAIGLTFLGIAGREIGRMSSS